MSFIKTITLKCDFHGCKAACSVTGDDITTARVRAADVKGWTSSPGRSVLGRVKDWCDKHPLGESLEAGLEDL